MQAFAQCLRVVSRANGRELCWQQFQFRNEQATQSGCNRAIAAGDGESMVFIEPFIRIADDFARVPSGQMPYERCTQRIHCQRLDEHFYEARCAQLGVRRGIVVGGRRECRRTLRWSLLGTNLIERPKTIQVRHMYIEQKEIERCAARQLQRDRAIGGFHAFDPQRRQRSMEELQAQNIVVGDEHTWHRHKRHPQVRAFERQWLSE